MEWGQAALRTAAGICLLLMPHGAAADLAESTTWVNVRPTLGSEAVDALAPGELVEVMECNSDGWCRVERDGPDGWVTSKYLTMRPELGAPPSPVCTLRISLPLTGPEVGVGCSAEPPEPAAEIVVPVLEDEACFYADAGFGGKFFCLPPGQLDSLPGLFDDKISSVRLYGSARAFLCLDPGQEGGCQMITTDQERLSRSLDNKASSVQVLVRTMRIPVFTVSFPFAVPEPPRLTSGTLELDPDYAADLDSGTVRELGADLVLTAQLLSDVQLVAKNGTQLAPAGRSVPGYFGCRDAAFSADPIPFEALTFSAYVCIRTSEGRIAQMRVNDNDGTRLAVSFATWEK
jgi:uncharacterized protein YraI